MQERVEDFIRKCENEKVKQEQKYRDLVMEYAGLTSSEKAFFEATEEEYKKVVALDPDSCKTENGIRYVLKKIPIEVSEEEFAAIENAIPEQKLESLRIRAERDIDKEDKSWASSFFTVIAWILWIGGLIISIVAANVTREVAGYYRTYNETSFSFQVFITTFLSYFVYGCIAMCAAELFKKLQTIVNLLERK